MAAHRVSWMISNGHIPDGMCVCHKCDVRECVNPDHLFLGSNKDNSIDMARKGRANAKLTIDDVHAIRADDRMQKVIASHYMISGAQVSRIKTLKKWGHLW